MANFVNSATNAFATGYDYADPRKDKNDKTAYQRYVEKFYGPGVTSHRDPLAVARAATGAVAQGLKSGAGFLSHAAAGLIGMPRGDSQASQRGASQSSQPSYPRASTDQNVVYGGRGGGGATGRMSAGNVSPGAGLSSPGSISAAHESFFQAISEAEGTTKHGYNTMYGGGFGVGGRPVTDMTIDEMTDHQRGMIRNQGASPIGRFQINRGTLIEHAGRLGLPGSTKLTPEVQNRLALSIAKIQGIAPPVWDGFRSHPKQFAAAKAAYSKIKGLPVAASAYAPTEENLTPAQQAAANMASGRASTSSTSYERSPQIAQMQRDLNSRGAKLDVDGIRGPLTMAAEKQFLGSPTSVRTPSFTSTPATSSNNWSSLQSPYTSSTGGANAIVSSVRTPSFTYDPTSSRPINPNRVPTVAVQSDVANKSPIPGYYDPQAGGNQTITGGRRVPVSTGYAPTTGPVLTGGFSRPAVPQTPYLNQPYTMTTGGANAITARVPQARPPQPGDTPTPYLNQPYTMPAWGANIPTARVPQARPDYQAPEQAVPTLIERLGNLVERAERVVGGNSGSDSKRGSSSNSGSSRSGGSNYSGGNYGGSGGSRISEGVGGAYRNR